ncbi:MAG: ssDNA-binding domain-containing protein, partial [Burkholderiaceae bacterium]|nr:ssDNA-binding domain-containing protein [Burkholderiaceae bacterium]
MNELTKSFVDKVAERIVGLLKEGTAPWQKPWQAGEADGLLPTNPVTGNRYKGINALHLMCQDREDQRWMTYKQAESIGAQVRQGEKGTPIQYWKFSEEHTKTDQNDQPVLDADGKQVKHTVRLERPALYMATVFNAAQIDGLPPAQRRSDQQNPAWSPIERAEGILQASGATVRHSNQDQAFYRAQTDTIHLPEKGQFAQPDQYYAVALHELGHWTGHESRLGRDMNHPFGSEGYAREELRAEIASMILGDELGVGHDPKQHAAYVGAWIKAIEDDPLEIFRAAADAEKIQEYVLGIEQKQQHEHQQEHQQGQALDDEAQQVADFLAANKNLLPGKVAQNALDAPPPLRAILADAAKMKALDPKVDALLQGMNQTYIDETKAVVAATLGRADTKELSEAAQMARSQMPAGAKHDLDDAELVADFIARNLNLTSDKVADNALQAPPALKAILSDNERMAALDGQVNTLLQNLNQAYIDETQSVIASALNRPDAQERQDRARQSWAMRPELPGNDSDDAQLIADFISANVNLYPDKVAANMMESSNAVKALMQDDRRIDALWGQVTA